MKKSAITFVLLLIYSVPALANGVVILDCTLVKLHDSGVFEESFSAHEYPSLRIWRQGPTGSYRASIGASAYTSESGDKMFAKVYEKSAYEKRMIVKITPSHGAEDYMVVYDAKQDSNVARLYSKSLQKGAKTRLIATMACTSSLTMTR